MNYPDVLTLLFKHAHLKLCITLTSQISIFPYFANIQGSLLVVVSKNDTLALQVSVVIVADNSLSLSSFLF